MNRQAILERRARQLADRHSSQEEGQGQHQVLCFELETECYGIALASLSEVMALQYTSLPAAPPGLLGIVNLRGVLISVLDLAVLLHLMPSDPKSGYLLILRESPPVAFRVGSELSIRTYRQEDLAVAGAKKPYFKGWTQDFVLLNIEKLLKELKI